MANTHPELDRLPAAALRALGQFYQDLGADLLRRARRADDAAAERERLRRHRDAAARIWRTVEGLRASGLRHEAALQQAAQLLSLEPDAVRRIHADAERRDGPHRRARRNLDIARRAAAGERPDDIARAVGLHPKSVARVIRRLLQARAFDVPGRAPTRPDGRLFLATLEPLPAAAE